MDSQLSFWQLGDELRGQSKVSEDHRWSMVASKLASQTREKGERMNNVDFLKGPTETRPREKSEFQEDNKFGNYNYNMLNLESKFSETLGKTSNRSSIFNMNTAYQRGINNIIGNINLPVGNKFNSNSYSSKEMNKNTSSNSNNNDNSGNNNGCLDKRFKTLPSTETLPRNEVLGGYIFVCNNDTMHDDLKRQLFGLPPRYRDSVRAITPGLPLFLYNYTTHQLHGIFEVCFAFCKLLAVSIQYSTKLSKNFGANIWLKRGDLQPAVSFGGSNIDPTAWEDKKCKGESRFPAQVRIRVRKLCNALEEDAFRPVLHHYDGPKFRLELSIPEARYISDKYIFLVLLPTLALLDLCEEGSM
ncbi:hypothetical protein GIB67_009340 [Kingdonia uniflora]|uniref:DCD domain-containing protein n=1 Tax=Kingdonia uniflora TaxID=39325 RepID=A0A7J7N2N0_9MAGN|nr:hypothetical protein GIB67_009340 [Kingdonia uniflora]